jgi:hypothetical protein
LILLNLSASQRSAVELNIFALAMYFSTTKPGWMKSCLPNFVTIFHRTSSGKQRQQEINWIGLGNSALPKVFILNLVENVATV